MFCVKQIILLLVAGLLLAISNYFVNPQRVAWDPTKLQEGELSLQMAMEVAAEQEVFWIDARTHANFTAGHIPGAILLNEDDWDGLFGAFLDSWNGEAKIVVYCGSGGCQASHLVANRLREELGFKDVWVLHGGWGAWEEAKQ